MKMHNYTITKFPPLTGKILADPNWGEHFCDNTGFTVPLNKKYFVSVFLDRRLLRPDCFLFIQEPEQIIARCVSCVGEIWEIRAEPTGPGRAGLVVYTHRGKALAAGTLFIEDGVIENSLETLYEGITNKGIKFSYKVEGKLSTDSTGKEVYTGTVSVTVSDER